MTGEHLSSTDNTINPRLAEKIKDLSEERQWILLQQLLEGNVIANLYGLISKMSDDEQLTLLDRLQELYRMLLLLHHIFVCHPVYYPY